MLQTYSHVTAGKRPQRFDQPKLPAAHVSTIGNDINAHWG